MTNPSPPAQTRPSKIPFSDAVDAWVDALFAGNFPLEKAPAMFELVRFLQETKETMAKAQA